MLSSSLHASPWWWLPAASLFFHIKSTFHAELQLWSCGQNLTAICELCPDLRVRNKTEGLPLREVRNVTGVWGDIRLSILLSVSKARLSIKENWCSGGFFFYRKKWSACRHQRSNWRWSYPHLHDIKVWNPCPKDICIERKREMKTSVFYYTVYSGCILCKNS